MAVKLKRADTLPWRFSQRMVLKVPLEGATALNNRRAARPVRIEYQGEDATHYISL